MHRTSADYAYSALMSQLRALYPEQSKPGGLLWRLDEVVGERLAIAEDSSRLTALDDRARAMPRVSAQAARTPQRRRPRR